MPSPSETPLLILAGGRATRLGDLADDRPKFLVPISDSLLFADFQLRWAKAQGFREVRLSVGYCGEQIEAYCGDGARFGLSVSYAFDGPAALGTGGAVKRAFRAPPPWIAVLYGDTILTLNCAEVLARATSDVLGVMTVLKDPPAGHVCNATLLDEWPLYSKRDPKPDWRYIDYGFLCLSAEFIRGIPDTTPLDLSLPLELASNARKLAAFEVQERFWEINTVQSLEEFRRHFSSG
jgi:NDP-sugar pyrophosphorylase family protein